MIMREFIKEVWGLWFGVWGCLKKKKPYEVKQPQTPNSKHQTSSLFFKINSPFLSKPFFTYRSCTDIRTTNTC